jgi:hypothetical protein
MGLLVRLVAKPGMETEVTSFLGGLALAEQEPATVAWFAVRLGPSEFGIFDAIPDDAGRQAHRRMRPSLRRSGFPGSGCQSGRGRFVVEVSGGRCPPSTGEDRWRST